MIKLKSKEEILLMKDACKLTRDTLDYVESLIQSGISTLELDRKAEEFIRKNHAIPCFKGYYGFTGSICASINDVVVHGIPSDKVILNNGDIISIDCGVFFKGFNGDAARTFAVGNISLEKQKLIDVTKECFFEGIKQFKIGNRIGDISNAIQKHAESHGYSVVREMVGHGIGREMHEDPQVPNYGPKGFGELIKSGLVLAIEPMINIGKKEIYIESDGWTCRTKDHKPSAHYENTVAITENGLEILTL